MLGAVRLVVETLRALLVAACGTVSMIGPGDTGAPRGPAGVEPTRPLDPLALVGLWQLDEATGEEPGAVLRLAADGMSLWRGCGVLSGGWRANLEGLFVGHIDGRSGTCPAESEAGPEWLRRAAGYRIEGAAGVLLDGRGETVARLLPGGRPMVGPDIAKSEAEPPVVIDRLRKAFAPAAPVPAGLRPADPAELVGRWVPADGAGAAAPQPPFVQLSAGGSWSGSDGCNGQGGRWVGGAGGSLLAVAAPQTLMSCCGADVGGWLCTASRAAFAGELLLLLDSAGTQIARLRPT